MTIKRGRVYLIKEVNTMTDKKRSLSDEGRILSKIGAEFEKLDVDAQNRAVNWLNSIINKGETVLLPIPPSGHTANPAGKTSTIRDMWKEKKPLNNYQKIAILASYEMKNKDQESILKKDIISLWKTIENPPNKQVLINAFKDMVKSYKYLVCVKKGTYSLGIRGQDLVAELPNPSKELLGPSKKYKKTQKKQ